MNNFEHATPQAEALGAPRCNQAESAISKTVQLLLRVESLNESGKALTQEPVRPGIKALIDAGLLKSSRMRCGPLGLLTGEVWLRVTEDGRKLLPQ